MRILRFKLLSSIIVVNIVFGHGCENRFAYDCQEIKDRGYTRSGVYTVTPVGTYTGIQVYCDMDTDGGGWLVFQRRQDGSLDFNRGWQEYRLGFGNVSREHWLGNQALYSILLQGHYELRIDLEDWEGNIAYASYANFKLGGSNEAFRLIIADYEGNAGSGLDISNGRSFSTKDRDYSSGCSKSYLGAWWYERFSCFVANLNGLYLTNGTECTNGTTWSYWKGKNYSLKRTELKVGRI